MVGNTESKGSSSEKTQRANRLNEAFKEGREAWEVLEDLQSLDKPILVDFNNVLFNNFDPFIPNPEGKVLLDGLKAEGDVIIATTAANWDAIHASLQESGMWNDELILMVMPNWGFMCEDTSFSFDKEKERVKEDFKETLRKRQIAFDEFSFHTAPAKKPLSPLFNKPFDIPLVDDSVLAARSPFPGILAIQVKPFVNEEEREYRDVNEGIPLLDSVSIVRNHYSGLTHDRMI